MLLTALKAYAEALPRTPSMYADQLIRYLVDLRADGTPLGPVMDLSNPAEKGREARGLRRLAPTRVRASAIKPKLLIDNAEYVLGVAREGQSPSKVRDRHAAFVNLVRQCAEQTHEPTVIAVQRFLDGYAARTIALELPDSFDPSANITFRVDMSVFPIDVDNVQAFWARATNASSTTEDAADKSAVGPSLACLVCGRVRPALRRMPYKIKNIPNGHLSGTSLISANWNAFESYGLEKSLIAPLCQTCAESVHKGMNTLIDDPATHLRRDPLLYVFWTHGAAGDLHVASFLADPQPDAVQALLNAAHTARAGALDIVDPTRFYALSLTGSGGRVAVRDWLDITVAEARRNLQRFFRRQSIVDLYHPGETLAPQSLARLASATVRDPRKDPPAASVMRSLYRTALAGDPLPPNVLFAVIRRVRADQSISPTRAALIKLTLLSQPNTDTEDTRMVGLDPEERSPAYLCGRLLAVLENIQRQALKDVNATIVDRFYGSASTTPLAVFPRLVRGAQAHLSRLRRESTGNFVNRQRELEEILAGLPSTKNGPAFPTILTLEQQGLFLLGYYHQRAHRSTRSSRDDQGSPDVQSAPTQSPVAN